MSEFEQQQITDNITLQRRALRVARIYLVVYVVMIFLSLYIAWQVRAWQIYTLVGISLISAIAQIVSIRLIRAGQIETGGWVIIYILWIFGLLASIFIATDFGIFLGTFITILTFVIASQVFSSKALRQAWVIGIGVGLLITLLSLVNISFRFSISLPWDAPLGLIVGAFIALALIFFIVRRALRGNLRVKLTVSFVLVAVIPLVIVGIIASIQTYNAQLPQALELQSQVAQRVAENVEDFIRARENELWGITNIRGLAGLSSDDQEELLASLLSAQNLYDEIILVDGNGQEQIYLSRVDIVNPDDLTNLSGAVEFEKPKESGATYFSPVQFDSTTGEPFMVISVPVIDLRTGEMIYALIANFRFKTVWNLMAQADVVGSGIVYMVGDDNQVIAHANPSVVLQGTQVDLPSSDSFTVGIDGTEVAMALDHISLSEQVFSVVAELPQSEVTALAIRNLAITIIVVVVAVLIASILGTFVARNITTPIIELADAAETVSAGDFSQQVEIDSQDEIGTLATAFNSMMKQLSDLVGTLEQQVSDRTRALETSTEVSRRLSTILDQEQLVSEVVEQLRSAFDYYHAHIYLYDEGKQNLVMAGGTGEAGRAMLAGGHSIEKGRGLVGRAASSNQTVLIPDVSRAIGWLPNPLLPDTKAEVAVPIAIGEEVLGVLDVQHNISEGLDEEDVDLIQAIANQVAVAVRNAQAYQQVQRQAVLEAQISAITQRIQSATTIEDVLRIAVSELGQALETERADIELSMIQKSNGGYNAS